MYVTIQNIICMRSQIYAMAYLYGIQKARLIWEIYTSRTHCSGIARKNRFSADATRTEIKKHNYLEYIYGSTIFRHTEFHKFCMPLC